MIVNCIGIGADEEESQIHRDFEDWNQSVTSFLVCSSTLSFVSILEFVLHFSISLFLRCLKDYEISGFI